MPEVTRPAIIVAISQRGKLGVRETEGYCASEWQTWNPMASSFYSCAHFIKLCVSQRATFLQMMFELNLSCKDSHISVHQMMQKRDPLGTERGDCWKLKVSTEQEHMRHCVLFAPIHT